MWRVTTIMSHFGEKKFVYFPGICFFDEVKNEDDKLQVPLSHFKTILFNVFPNIFLLANYHKENLLLLFSFCSSCFQTCSAILFVQIQRCLINLMLICIHRMLNVH